MRSAFITILLASSAFAQLPGTGWTDLGAGTVLHNSAFKSGLSILPTCTGGPPPPACVNVAVNEDFLGLDSRVVAAQSGAAVDTNHNCMYITGGGHADYYGNQVYSLCYPFTTLTRLTDPSPIYSAGQRNLDGTGVTSHTQQGLIYMPGNDCVFHWGLGVGPAPLVQREAWWICNPRTNPTWIEKSALPNTVPFLAGTGATGCPANSLQTGSFVGGGGTGATFSIWIDNSGVPTGYASLPDNSGDGTAYTSVPTQGTVSNCTGTLNFTSGGLIQGGSVIDAAADAGGNCMIDTTASKDRILCIPYEYYQVWAYDPSLDTGPGSTPWTALAAQNTAEIVAGSTCAIDPINQVMICAGATESFGFPSGVYSISLAAGSSYASTNITSSLVGCSALYSTLNPGFKYDSSTGLFVGWAGTGNTITEFDYATSKCYTKTFANGPTATSTPWGMYDRFAYFPSLNEYVVLNNATTDAFVLRLFPVSTGLGKSTLASGGPCLDVDGDGYGVGASCTGPDADDNDATVNTTASVISRYGSVNAFEIHLGYQNSSSPATVWCISPSGNDGTGASSTNADTACASPFLTYGAVIGHLVTPYMVVLRTGTYTFTLTGIGGTFDQQNYFLSYPGEQYTLDCSTRSGTCINMQNTGFVTFDGGKTLAGGSSTGFAGGTAIDYMAGTQVISSIENHVYHFEMSGGGEDSNVDGDNTRHMVFMYNVLHDPFLAGGQHNIYLGCNTSFCSGATITANITYGTNSQYPSIQFNGRCYGCYMDQNMTYNSAQQAMSALEGYTHSYVRDNLTWNTGNFNGVSSFVLYNYPGGGPTQCNFAGISSICPWDQTYNTIENNTFWVGLTSFFDMVADLKGPTVIINNIASTVPCGDGSTPSPVCGVLTNNYWHNNIIVGPGAVNPGANSGYPAVAYWNLYNYPAGDKWANNLLNTQDNSTSVFAYGPGMVNGFFPYTCTAFAAIALGNTGCSTAAPGFTNVSTSLWATPELFNFSLASGSAAIGAGTQDSLGMDILGNVRSNPPSLGAFEFTGCAISPPTLPGGTVGIVYSQTLTNSGCNPGTWAHSGSLPAGLSGCNSGSGTTCTITGTPTGAGTSSLTVTYDTASDPLSITITGSGSAVVSTISGGKGIGGGNSIP